MSGSLPSDIARLAELFTAGGFKDLRVETPGISVHLSADPASARLGAAALAPVAAPIAAPLAAASVPAVAPVLAPVLSGPASADWAEARAPNLGTFYRSPKPGSAPFVEIGQTVGADSEICLIEVMKLFTSVKAGVSGTIRKVCVEDGVLVEGGQVLFLIETN